MSQQAAPGIERVALLTGGADRPYAFGLATALIARGIPLDVIGSDELDASAFHASAAVRFVNLRGSQRRGAGLGRKAARVLLYYARLFRYGWISDARVFHILWNNKFEIADRVFLMAFYRLAGRRVVLTAHNVNARKRDGRDTLLNRLTLQVQYALSHHIFVHTARMKSELVADFGVRRDRVTVIPFGINNAVPNGPLTPAEARRRLGLAKDDKAILFFGNIAPYKGLEYLVDAFATLSAGRNDVRLIVAGRPRQGCESYWQMLRRRLGQRAGAGRVIERIEYIPDDEVEVFFKGADLLVLPYTEIFQSGVLFLGYSFGLPVVAADVGSLADDVREGETGFMFRAGDTADLARAIEAYFASDLFANLDERRVRIRRDASERHSWATVARTTEREYARAIGAGRTGASKKAVDPTIV